MTDTRRQTIYILTFPIVLTVGIVPIPVVTDYSDHRLAEQAVQQTARWIAGHIVAAIEFTFSILVVGSIDNHLQLSSRSLPVLTLPCVALGAWLYAPVSARTGAVNDELLRPSPWKRTVKEKDDER